MVSQYLAQSLLKQMGGAVVLACKSAVVGADRQGHCFPYLEHAFCHDSHMAYLAALKMYGILYLKGAVFIGNNACISLLAAHGSVNGVRSTMMVPFCPSVRACTSSSSVVSTVTLESAVSLS